MPGVVAGGKVPEGGLIPQAGRTARTGLSHTTIDDIIEGGGASAETHIESLLREKSMGIVRMFIQVVNKSIQISKLKKEGKALRR